jgi:hypothetical protein
MDNAQVQAAPKKGKSSMIIIIVIIVLLCCCVSTAAGVGGYLVLKNKNKNDDNKTTTVQTTSSKLNTTSTTSLEKQPTLTEVSNELKSVKSYRIHAEFTEAMEKYEIDAEYQAPDKEKVVQTEAMAVTEEIAIGTTIYKRVQGGTWEVIDEAVLTGFTDSLINDILSGGTAKLDGDSDGYWKYTITNPDDATTTIIMLVDKETSLPVSMEFTGGNEGLIQFQDYNDASIQIEAPI